MNVGDQRTLPPAPSLGEGERARPAAWWKLARFLLHFAIPALVVFMVREEIRRLDLRAVRTQLAGAQTGLVALAALAGIGAVGSMGLYDVLAFHTRPSLGWLRRWRLGATFFAWTNFLTLGPIGGPALRLHFYRKAGMPAIEILRGVARMYAGMFAGLATWVGIVLLPLPVSDRSDGLLVRTAIVIVVAPALAVLIGFLATRWKRLERAKAPWPTMALMGLVGVLDWGGGLLAFLLASRAVGIIQPPGEVARTMVIGNVIGMASLVPGGMGTADAIWLHRLSTTGAGGLDPGTALAGAVMFRLTFYIVPWLIGLLGLFVAFTGKSPQAAIWQRRILAAAATVNAVLLLASAATPSAAGRFQRVANYLPVDMTEVSNAVAVVSAAIMLFLVRGLLFGYRAAFALCGSLLLASIVAHILNGSDFDETLLSCGLLILLVGARRAFPRRGRIPIGWELTLAAALGSTLFVVLASAASFPEVRYTHDLWLRLTGQHAEAARLLRAAALVAGVALVFLVRQAVRPAKERRLREGPA